MVRQEYGCFVVLVLVSGISAQGLGFWGGNNIFSQGEFTDIVPDNWLSYILNNRDNLLPQNRAPCISSNPNGGEILSGTCMHRTECGFSSGRGPGRGNCTFGNVCCIYSRTCRQTARSRVAYFNSQNSGRNATDQSCSLHIQTINEDISQIRVDIITLELAKPIGPSGSTEVTCKDDSLTVSPPPAVKVPSICGTSSKTHFYIHLAPGQRSVHLNVLLKGITTPPNEVSNPSWKIQITQLESVSKEKKFDLRKRNPDQAYFDRGLLAPPGCMQYFNKPSDVVRSFGFKTTTKLGEEDSTLTTDQNYAACFRNDYNCGVMFTIKTDEILLRADADCKEAYVAIPEIDPPPMTPADGKICDKTVLTTPPTDPLIKFELNSKHPGPLYIHVNIMEKDAAATAFGGFKMDYRINTSC